MTIFRNIHFPKLVGDFWGNKPITQTWRHIMRHRTLNEHPLEVILLNTRQGFDQSPYPYIGGNINKMPILKEICNNELKEFVRMKKIQRNNERALLSLYGIRENMPLDVINNIQEYMTFVKYF